MIRNMLNKVILPVLLAGSLYSPSLPAYWWGDNCYCTDEHFWLDAEYLYWMIEDSPKTVPLVISGPEFSSVIGDAGTSIVLGNKSIDNNWRSGGRFALGCWIDECFAAEGSYFFLGSGEKKYSTYSSGLPDSPFLGVPYYNINTDAEGSISIANNDPDLNGGAYSGLGVLKVKNSMQNAELNGLMRYDYGCDWGVVFLVGFRYWNFDEDLTFFVDSPYIDNAEDVFNFTDKFNVQNNFYGGQLGISFDYFSNCFFFNIKGKVALGADYTNLNIHGNFLTNLYNTPSSTGTPVEYVGGAFALPTNIGGHKKTFFSVIPEVNVNLGYEVMDNLRLQIGYTFLYVSKMMWATNQIDRDINPTQSVLISDDPDATLVGTASPTALSKTDSLWVQGVSVGLEYRF